MFYQILEKITKMSKFHRMIASCRVILPKWGIWVSLFIERNTAVYFDSLGIEYISLEVLKKIRDKPITHNIFRIQDN